MEIYIDLDVVAGLEAPFYYSGQSKIYAEGK